VFAQMCTVRPLALTFLAYCVLTHRILRLSAQLCLGAQKLQPDWLITTKSNPSCHTYCSVSPCPARRSSRASQGGSFPSAHSCASYHLRIFLPRCPPAARRVSSMPLSWVDAICSSVVSRLLAFSAASGLIPFKLTACSSRLLAPTHTLYAMCANPSTTLSVSCAMGLCAQL
jgi:hypothetical protein